MNKFSRLLIVLTVAALLFTGVAFSVKDAAAAEGTFNISVYHNINGRSLGLSRELPVIASIYKDGKLLANIPLSFKDRVTADLPAGTYEIKVNSVEAGPVPSMNVGPVFIPADAAVRAQAQLGAGGAPILSVRVK